MKNFRLPLVLLASLAMSSFAFAVPSGQVASSSVVRVKNANDSFNAVAVGTAIESDALVQVGEGGSLTLTLADGATVTFAANSSFRLKPASGSSSGQFEIVLLAGSVSGNFNTGAGASIIIRTSSGEVDTNKSTSVTVAFTPPASAGVAGALNVTAAAGTVSVKKLDGQVVQVSSENPFTTVSGAGQNASAQSSSSATANNGDAFAKVAAATQQALGILSPSGTAQKQ